jgi:hypothetical protein
MRFLSVHQLAVSACRYRWCIALFQAFLVQMTAPTPHIMGRLLAASPDMAELLAVVTLCEAVCALYASTLIEIWHRLLSLSILWDFDVLGKIIRKRGCVMWFFLLQVIEEW